MNNGNLRYELFKLDDDTQVNAVIKNESVWLTQKAMSELFQVDRTSISKHLKNIFERNELDESMVCEEFTHTTQHGAIEGKLQTRKINRNMRCYDGWSSD